MLLFLKKAAAVAKVEEGPDKPIATPSAILSMGRGFRRNLASPRCFFLDTRRFLPISPHTSGRCILNQRFHCLS